MTREGRPSRADRKIARATSALPHVPADTPATPAARGFAECPCPKDCALHGSCLLCVAYHAPKRPRCER